MKKKYYRYFILTWLFIIFIIIYIYYNNSTLESTNINLKEDIQYFSDIKSKSINNTTLTNQNKF